MKQQGAYMRFRSTLLRTVACDHILACCTIPATSLRTATARSAWVMGAWFCAMSLPSTCMWQPSILQ